MHQAGVNRAERIPNPCDIMYQPYGRVFWAGANTQAGADQPSISRDNSFFLHHSISRMTCRPNYSFELFELFELFERVTIHYAIYAERVTLCNDAITMYH